jgi:virulence-associated protein VagC
MSELRILNIPEYLGDIFTLKSGSQELLERDRYNIITPSGQQWEKLSPTQREVWKKLVSAMGKNPEDYLHHMRLMLPENPKGQ